MHIIVNGLSHYFVLFGEINIELAIPPLLLNMTRPECNILGELSCFYTHPPCFASPRPKGCIASQIRVELGRGIYFTRIGCQQHFVLLTPYSCDYQRETPAG